MMNVSYLIIGRHVAKQYIYIKSPVPTFARTPFATGKSVKQARKLVMLSLTDIIDAKVC